MIHAVVVQRVSQGDEEFHIQLGLPDEDRTVQGPRFRKLSRKEKAGGDDNGGRRLKGEVRANPGATGMKNGMEWQSTKHCRLGKVADKIGR